MKLYSSQQAQNFQLLKKYCFDVDADIQDIVNFIDTFNANYIVLNKNAVNDSTIQYYTEAQLTTIGILDISNSLLDITKMSPHQIVQNIFKKTMYVQYNSRRDEIPQGYALRHDGFKSDGTIAYSIISLSSSGSYYVVQRTELERRRVGLETASYLKVYWTLQEHATDLYGLEYLINLLLPGSRFFYHSSSSINMCPLFATPMIIGSFGSSPSDPRLATKGGSLWDINNLLEYDIVLYHDNSIEDVFCDSTHRTSAVRVGEYPQSRYTINTEMSNTWGIDNPSLHFYINFY